VASGKILVVATLDTKGPEASYLCERIAERGPEPLLVDVGVLGEPDGVIPDVTREQVAKAAGRTIDEVRAVGARGTAVGQMMEGLRELVPRLFADNDVAGGVGIGGAEGALLASAALSGLPFGLPKIIVSPILSGVRRCGSFVRHEDIALLHSVVDLQGLNYHTATVLDLAASMVAGGGARVDWPESSRARVGMSLNGNTTKVGTQIRKELEGQGYEVVSFHSNGVGGVTMEEIAAQGGFVAVVDLTTNELVEEVVDGLFSVRDRLVVSGRTDVPRVVVPGCLDFVCQGPLGEVEERFRDRPMDIHNPEITLVRISPEEARHVAREFVRRLLESKGPVRVVVPTGGLSIPGSPGGNFTDPEADGAFTRALLEDAALGGLPLTLVDAPINDDRVSCAVVEAFEEAVTAPASRDARAGAEGTGGRTP
jgi:uncharacterized protein (UPF0261 family)